VTFLATRELLRISPYVPGPLIAIGIGSLLVGATDGASVALISTKYGTIPTNFWVLTPPAVGGLSWPNVFDVTYMAVAIVFVSAVESLLCSRMADRMAENRGTPFNPDKELWGQGWVQLIVPFLNGFPHTGALARTATNIKLGARTPLAGIFKGILKLVLALCLARYLEQVPMACLGGVLLWVAVNMVKPAEIKQVLAHSRFHAAVMVYTALAVMVTDFLTGVLTALALYGVLFRFFDKPGVRRHEKGHQAGSAADPAGSTSRQPALSPELAPSGPIYDMPR
jgi:MFS superfamily sulfate permease-like transporter